MSENDKNGMAHTHAKMESTETEGGKERTHTDQKHKILGTG